MGALMPLSLMAKEVDGKERHLLRWFPQDPGLRAGWEQEILTQDRDCPPPAPPLSVTPAS